MALLNLARSRSDLRWQVDGKPSGLGSRDFLRRWYNRQL